MFCELHNSHIWLFSPIMYFWNIYRGNLNVSCDWHSWIFNWSNNYFQDLTASDQRWSCRVGIMPLNCFLFFFIQFDYFCSKLWRSTLNVLCSKCFVLCEVENFHHALTFFSKYILRSSPQTKTSSKRWKWDRAPSPNSIQMLPIFTPSLANCLLFHLSPIFQLSSLFFNNK